jgi:hypothetical protein
MFWEGIAVDQVMKIMKSERISMGVLVLFVCSLFIGISWADGRFAKIEDLTTLQHTMELGFESIAINDASAEIRDIKLSMQLAQAVDPSESTTKRIEEELEHAVDYKKCLVRREPNCEYLREVE